MFFIFFLWKKLLRHLFSQKTVCENERVEEIFPGWGHYDPHLDLQELLFFKRIYAGVVKGFSVNVNLDHFLAFTVILGHF